MWTKLEVYNGDRFLGSFYTNETEQKKITEVINENIKEVYGTNTIWTRYNIGN